MACVVEKVRVGSKNGHGIGTGGGADHHVDGTNRDPCGPTNVEVICSQNENFGW